MYQPVSYFSVTKMEMYSMIYGYARVSTVGQDLHSQILELKQHGAEIINSEKFTGTKMERPEFEKLINQLNSGDTLMVTKLDRFARNSIEAQRVVKELFDRGVAIHILNLGIIENTPSGRLTFNIFSAFAEFERDMIVTRTQEGKAYARAHNPNYREGRKKKYTPAQLDLAMTLLKTHSYSEVVKSTGISKSTLIRENNRRKCL